MAQARLSGSIRHEKPGGILRRKLQAGGGFVLHFRCPVDFAPRLFQTVDRRRSLFTEG